VGNDGETLVADSSASTGLRWTGDYAAGKNKFINGDMAINQRAFTSTTISASYTVDRFAMINVGGGDLTVSTQTFGADAPVSGYDFGTYIRLVTSGTGDASSAKIFRQKIENVATFANQTVTISFYAKASTGTPSVAMSSRQLFGTGGSATVETYVGKTAITSSWARYSFVYAVPSISGKTVGAGSNLEFQLWASAGSTYNSVTNSLGTQNVTIDTWGWQVEAGSVATAFQTATGTIQGELAACQRYYYLYVDGNTSTSFGTCAYYSSSDVLGTVTYPVTMRTTPTFSAASGSFYEVVRNSGSNTLSGLQANYLTTRTANIFAGSGQGASGTAGHAGQYRTISVSANAAFSAEL
jgi:hypothetical protein